MVGLENAHLVNHPIPVKGQCTASSPGSFGRLGPGLSPTRWIVTFWMLVITMSLATAETPGNKPDITC